MSTLILENNWLKATFKIFGAELSSLVSKTNNTEHIWQADPAIWNRHAPILFPVVGQVENNSYFFEGVEYKMSQHGFARDKEFKIELHTADKIVFSLESNDETLKNYPFGFKLFITYTLISDQLKITYNVANTDSKIIYFSIGAHPGLICPFQENENFEDFILEFEKPEIATRHFFADGLLNGKLQEKYLDNSQIIPLSYNLFKDDAIILEGLDSEFVDLKSLKTGKYLRFYFKGFPLLAFWTKPGINAKFICIEPWFGVADVKGRIEDFSEKPFVQQLGVGDIFKCEYSIKL